MSQTPLSFGENDDAQILAKGVHAILANKTSALAQRRTFELFTLTGKVVLLTGALGGLGLEMTFALAEVGATVYCVDTADEPSETWVQMRAYLDELPELASGGKGRLEYVKGDVRDHDGMDKIVKDVIVGKEGRIDVCFAHAGIGGVTPALDIPESLLQDARISIRITFCWILIASTGLQCKHQRMLVHSSGGRTGDEETWDPRKHHLYLKRTRIRFLQGMCSILRPIKW